MAKWQKVGEVEAQERFCDASLIVTLSIGFPPRPPLRRRIPRVLRPRMFRIPGAQLVGDFDLGRDHLEGHRAIQDRIMQVLSLDATAAAPPATHSNLA